MIKRIVDKLFIFYPLFLSLLVGFLSVLRRQDTNGDVWNYHLYNAYALLSNRLGYDLGPAGAHSYLNPYLDVAFYLATRHLNPYLLAYIMGALQGLVAYPIMYISKYFIENKKIQLAITALCCFGSTFFVGELGSSMHDNITSVFILSSLCFILYGLGKNEYKYISISGLVIGVASGLKLTSALYIPVFLSIILIYYSKKVKESFCFCLTTVTGLLISTGWWCYKLYIVYGSPLFPFFNNIFHSPYASLDKDATRDMMFFQTEGLEKIIYPFYFAEHINRVVTAVNDKNLTCYSSMFCFILLVIYFSISISKTGLIKSLKRKINLLYLFFFLSFYVWQYVFGVYRYFISTDLICPIIICSAIIEIINMQKIKINNANFVAFMCSVPLVAISYIGGIPDWGRGSYKTPYLSGNIPVEIRNADILFNANFFSAWIYPAIIPNGHIIQINRGMFDFGSKLYWDNYYKFIPHNREPNQYVLFEDINNSDAKNWAIDKFKDHYSLKIDFSSCKTFSLRLSSYERGITYCALRKI
ncbi:hypothetical protein [Acetobacter indonesiensis]|nr:hypothetical protein [Acetobacter indonesiensis]